MGSPLSFHLSECSVNIRARPTRSRFIFKILYIRNIEMKPQKIILTIGTHGDEKIGLKVVEALSKFPIIKGELIVHIGNEKAFNINKRFIDQDLNRAFPGKKDGNYEERRAYELLPLIKSADIVIDIHSTTSELKDAVIVTQLNKKTQEYIDIISPKYALIMKATKKNALISYAKVGIAFEYGKDNDPNAIRKVVLGIRRLLAYIEMIDSFGKNRKTPNSIFFTVNKVIPKNKNALLNKNIKNYKLVEKGQVYATVDGKKIIAKNNFYPILFGQNNYDDIFGFAAKKIIT